VNWPAEREQNSLTAASIAQGTLRTVKIWGNGAADSTSIVTSIEKLADTVAKKEIRFYLFPVRRERGSWFPGRFIPSCLQNVNLKKIIDFEP
jgi:hypothetical protein